MFHSLDDITPVDNTDGVGFQDPLNLVILPKQTGDNITPLNHRLHVNFPASLNNGVFLHPLHSWWRREIGNDHFPCRHKAIARKRDFARVDCGEDVACIGKRIVRVAPDKRYRADDDGADEEQFDD